MKTIYEQPHLKVSDLSVEAGFAASVYGFESNESGEILGVENSAGNGYSAWDNGEY